MYGVQGFVSLIDTGFQREDCWPIDQTPIRYRAAGVKCSGIFDWISAGRTISRATNWHCRTRRVRFDSFRVPLCHRCPLKTSAEPALATMSVWSGWLLPGCCMGFGRGFSVRWLPGISRVAPLFSMNSSRSQIVVTTLNGSSNDVRGYQSLCSPCCPYPGRGSRPPKTNTLNDRRNTWKTAPSIFGCVRTPSNASSFWIRSLACRVPLCWPPPVVRSLPIAFSKAVRNRASQPPSITSGNMT